MNVLPSEKRAQILNCLVEGCSMRSTQRLTGAAKKTVERLLVAAGKACAEYHDKNVRGLRSTKVQIDEIWSFVGSKEKRTPEALRGTGERGDVWTWTAIDADSKLIISTHTGTHENRDAHLLLIDLHSRLANRVQLTTDGLRFYPMAVESAFGNDVDFAQIVKIFERKSSGKYSPPVCIGTIKTPKMGNPDSDEISTSYVERQNMTIRMSNRRFTRLTNAFSKKLENHRHSLAIHFMHYNFCRIHQTLRVTPAMAAGLTDHVWELSELVALTRSEKPM
jgi:IS1 family transposase